MLEMAMDAAIYDYGIVPGRDDRFLTLSTCSFDIPGVGLLPLTLPNDYRFVVLARLVDPGEANKDEAITLREGIVRENEFDRPLVQHLNQSALVLQGTVQRTTKSDEPQDWDATQLLVGTQVYADPMYPRVLVVDYDGERLYYVTDNVRLLLMRDGEVLAVRAIDNDSAELLWPDDMPDDDLIVDRVAPPSFSSALRRPPHLPLSLLPRHSADA